MGFMKHRRIIVFTQDWGVYHKGEKAAFSNGMADRLIDRGYADENMSVEQRDAINLKKVGKEAEQVKKLMQPTTEHKAITAPEKTKRVYAPKNKSKKSSSKKSKK